MCYFKILYFTYLYMSWTRHTQPSWPHDWNNFGFKEFKIVYIIIIIGITDWLTDKPKSYKLLLVSYKIKQNIKIIITVDFILYESIIRY